MRFPGRLLMAGALLVSPAWAHGSGPSSAVLDLEHARLVVAYAQEDLRRLFPRASTSASAWAVVESLSISAGGEAIVPRVTGWAEGGGTLRVWVELDAWDRETPLVLRFPLLDAVDPEQSLQLCVRGPGKDRYYVVRAGDSLVVGGFSGAGPFLLGAGHVLAGWDHLLFVLVLVVGADRWPRAGLLVTSFALGHAFSLSMVQFGWSPSGSPWVEPLIALTIVHAGLSGALSSLPGTPRFTPALVFLTGAAHGLGFAAAFATLDAGPSALLAFSLGIEVVQLGWGGLVFLAASRLPPVWPPRVSACAAIAGAVLFASHL